MKQTRAEFIKEYLFETRMSAKGGMDGYHNYMGHDWAGWLCGPAQARDADALTRSNYRVALARLGGESEGSVECRSVNHWAVGYIDQIMVRADSKQAVDKLQEIYSDMDAYPVLDEDDWSQEESAEADQTFKYNYREFRKAFLAACEFKHPDLVPRAARDSQLEALVDRAYQEDIGYRSVENAWVTEDSVKRYFEHEGRYEIPRMAKEGNRFARAILSCGLVKAAA